MGVCVAEMGVCVAEMEGYTYHLQKWGVCISCRNEGYVSVVEMGGMCCYVPVAGTCMYHY